LVDGPVSAPVPSYEVRVEGDTVYVRRYRLGVSLGFAAGGA
jgi:hypothetical protein